MSRARVLAALLGAAALLAGTTVGVLALTRVRSAADAVAGYYAALRAGSATTALSLGAPPSGDTHLLTDAVLRQQQRIGPISAVTVGAVSASGERAEVAVSYHVGGRTPADRNETVPVHRFGNGWQLDRTSVPVTVRGGTAAHRMTLGGGALPAGPVQLFPGVVPVGFDTPYLQVHAGQTVTLAGAVSYPVDAEISTPGRAALAAILDSGAGGCLTGRGSGCDLAPDGTRCVPGTLRGSVRTPPSQSGPSFMLDPRNSDGLVRVTGTFRADARWTALDFENQPHPQHRAVTVSFVASFYLSTPRTIAWTRP